LRILLCDDNQINLKVAVRILQQFGYKADTATNGREAVAVMERQPYDMVFMDVQMPEMDGLECARQICNRWTRDKRPVVIAMTGNALMGDREKCLAAGMDDYISKPVRIAELQASLERWGPTKSRKFDTSLLRRGSESSASTEVLDESILAELRDIPPSDGVSMLRELIDLFLESAPARLAQIEQFCHDAPKLAFHAHALKSMSLNLGCKRIVAFSQHLEELGRSGQVQDALPLVRELELAFSQTKAELLALRDAESARMAQHT
jgi:CheY-like chemotaxis protein/HPt (histidine-containing phosphotransfer) domain-containing protein